MLDTEAVQGGARSRFATTNAMMFVGTVDGGSYQGVMEALMRRIKNEPPEAVMEYLAEADAPMLRLFILRAVERLDEKDGLLPK